MSTTYRIKGRRFVRKYTAANLSPSTAAGSDVAAISDLFCKVPWTQAPLDAYPEFPTYASQKVDENVGIRECFDAAEWCGEHDDSKMHRCFANAAIYRYRLPASATLESVSVTVTCDPYTPQGARVAAMCTDSDDLPTDCSVVRTMDAHHDGVAPRTAVTNSSTGAVTWYETTASKTLTLNSTGKKWLLVFIGLEDYRARNGWLEGAAKIDKVSATFSGDVAGWDEGSQVDLRFEGVPAVALAGGSSPTWLQPLSMSASSGESASTYVDLSKFVFVPLSGKDYGFLIQFTVRYTFSTCSMSLTAKSCLVSYDTTAGTITFPSSSGYSSATVTKTHFIYAESQNLGLCIDDDFYKVVFTGTRSQVTSTISFVMCHQLVEGEVKLYSFTKDPSSTDTKFTYSVIELGKIGVQNPDIDASSSVRPDGSSGEQFGDMSWQIATADIKGRSRTASDTYRHLSSLTRETSSGVAHDYAFAGGSFPHSDIDRVTVVPRFARASSFPTGQSSISQPGISLWFHKNSEATILNTFRVGTSTKNEPVLCVRNLSFIQGCFIAVRSTSDGNRIRLTAIGSVSCSGLSLRLDVWKSSGVQWDGAAGFHTAHKLVSVPGFVDGSEPSVVAPVHSWDNDSIFAGLPDIGGVTAQLIGRSDTISTTISENGQIDITLESPVSEGDVIIINPVPVGLADGFTGTDAWFGRSGDPSTEPTKSWCRYSQNLGWYPKIEIM